MATRRELHTELLKITPNVYYQPPSSVQMKYDCIVYDLSNIDALHADDIKYQTFKSYLVTYISRQPADDKVDEILRSFRYVRFDRHYTADNLHHYSFVLYF